MLTLPTLFRGKISLPAFELHYTSAGEADSHDVILLLHGYTDSWHSFSLVMPALAEERLCFAPDHRGHGRSSYGGDDLSMPSLAADAARLLDAMGVKRAAVVGHSMGSFVARRLALARPDLVERLVLIGTGPRGVNEVVQSLAAEVRAFGDRVPEGFSEAFQASTVLDRSALPADFFEECVNVSNRLPVRIWKSAIEWLLADDHFDRLKEISCPTLVTGGVEDGVFSVAEQEAVAAAIPGSRLKLYEAAGHAPHWEIPDRFAADLRAFLGE
jgi:pimeloyl-ACP methyl ester carboxylesterase